MEGEFGNIVSKYQLTPHKLKLYIKTLNFEMQRQIRGGRVSITENTFYNPQWKLIMEAE